MVNQLKIGMVGTGFMGRAHSNAYRRVNQFFDVAYEPVLKAVVARSKEKTEAFARRWGWERAEDDWRKLIDAPDIDVIDICSPNNTHYEIAMAAAAKKKIILCEKPGQAGYRRRTSGEDLPLSRDLFAGLDYFPQSARRRSRHVATGKRSGGCGCLR